VAAHNQKRVGLLEAVIEVMVIPNFLRQGI